MGACTKTWGTASAFGTKLDHSSLGCASPMLARSGFAFERIADSEVVIIRLDGKRLNRPARRDRYCDHGCDKAQRELS